MLGAGSCARWSAVCQMSRNALPKSGRETRAHLEKRVRGADEHASDRDGPHNVSPDRVRHRRPVVGSIGWNVLPELRAEKKNEQRNHQSPGDHAAGKLNGGQAHADDVAHAEIRRADAGRGEHACAARGNDVCAARRSKPDLAVAETADADVKS